MKMQVVYMGQGLPRAHKNYHRSPKACETQDLEVSISPKIHGEQNIIESLPRTRWLHELP